nr:V-type proton ATPase subunit e-like isoform X2 [Danaus plexippus plexippus]
MVRALLEDEKTEIEVDDSFYDDWDSEINRFRRQEPPESETETKEYFLVPLYAITGFFAVMMFIGPFFVRRGPLRGIMLAAFCMWIFWFTIYFGQMNPLMGPRLDNTTVAWIAYKLGNSVET